MSIHRPPACGPGPPPRSATLADLQAIERGCEGEGPLDLRDQAILSILKTTAARNSSVRLLRIEDVDFERAILIPMSGLIVSENMGHGIAGRRKVMRLWVAALEGWAETRPGAAW